MEPSEDLRPHVAGHLNSLMYYPQERPPVETTEICVKV